jgi:hypothetical protein
MLHLFIIPHVDSIKPSLQFLCYFVVINASEGSLCFQNFVQEKVARMLVGFWHLSRPTKVCRSQYMYFQDLNRHSWT